MNRLLVNCFLALSFPQKCCLDDNLYIHPNPKPLASFSNEIALKGDDKTTCWRGRWRDGGNWGQGIKECTYHGGKKKETKQQPTCDVNTQARKANPYANKNINQKQNMTCNSQTKC